MDCRGAKVDDNVDKGFGPETWSLRNRIPREEEDQQDVENGVENNGESWEEYVPWKSFIVDCNPSKKRYAQGRDN